MRMLERRFYATEFWNTVLQSSGSVPLVGPDCGIVADARRCRALSPTDKHYPIRFSVLSRQMRVLFASISDSAPRGFSHEHEDGLVYE